MTPSITQIATAEMSSNGFSRMIAWGEAEGGEGAQHEGDAEEDARTRSISTMSLPTADELPSPTMTRSPGPIVPPHATMPSLRSLPA